jgi:tetratricopeptide (TPR) repeat protein
LQGIIFHLAGTAAVFVLARRLGAGPAAAALAAAVFALHPAQVESVTWISGRRTAMAGAFVLLAMVAWHEARFDGRRTAYGSSIAWALLGNLAKQSAVMTAPLLAAIELVAPRAEGRPEDGPAAADRSALARARAAALAYLPHAALTVLFFAIAIVVGRRESVIRRTTDLATRLETPFASLLRYGRIVLWPAQLQPQYRLPAPRGPLDPLVLGGAALAAALVAAAIGLRRRAPLAAVGSAVALLAILPGIAALGTQSVAERYLYISLAGVGLIAAEALGRLARRDRVLAAALGGAIVLALGTATWLRVGVWRDDLTLFRDATAADPESTIQRRYLGLALMRAGRLDEGERELRRAAGLAALAGPGQSEHLVLALRDLGETLEKTGDLAEAGRSFDAAASVAAESGAEVDAAGLALAGFRLRRGEVEGARAALAAAIARDPAHAESCRAALGRLDALAPRVPGEGPPPR